MSRLEQLENVVIEPLAYQAPSRDAQAAPFRFARGHWFLFGLALLCVLFITFITVARSIQVTAFTANLSKPDERLLVPAEIEIQSWIKLRIGNRVMVLPGSHQVSASATGYVPVVQSIDIGAERYQQLELVLQPLPGILDINLVPEVEATVLLDGKAFGRLPGLLEKVPAGKHELTIDAPLYRANTSQLLVEGKGQTQTISLSLQPAWAELSINSLPSGAIVSVDGEVLGNTPLVTKVEEGARTLTVSAAKFKSFEQEITVVAQQSLLIPDIQLQAADGVLELQTDPEQAAVIVNGEFRGTSPITLNLPPNQVQKVQLYKAGYRVLNREFSLAPEQRELDKPTLQADLVPIKFSVRPKDALIYVDGVRRGQGSITLSLNTLPHQVSVRREGYQTEQRQIIPTRTNQQIVSVELLTREQHFWANIPNTYKTAAGQKMMLFKSPGKVTMGSSRREDGRRANEVSYTAQLKKHFYVSQHEVTNKQFRAFRVTHNAGNYKKKSLDASKHPAVNISWQEAALYCNWLSKKEGLEPFYQTKSGYVSDVVPQANGYRLPTEVEWSWLARNKEGGVLTYPWGNRDLSAGAKASDNFADINATDLIAFTLSDYDDGFQASSPVGRYPVNHRGLYDLGGNVSEWVNDWYSAKGNSSSDSSADIVDPLGPDIGEFHVIRGGSWAKGHLPQLRLAYRDFGAKGKHDVGFRIARYVGPPK